MITKRIIDEIECFREQLLEAVRGGKQLRN